MGNTTDTVARGRATMRGREFNLQAIGIQPRTCADGIFRLPPPQSNDPPEPGLNFDGYNFWLNKLNEFNGNFVNTEMVKAFIVSAEYRQRFGQ